MPKAPPKFVTDIWAWEYTLLKMDGKDMLTEDGNPRNYGAAVAIYKNVVKKYRFINPDTPDTQEVRAVAAFDDRALTLRAAGATWRPTHGILIGASEDEDYMLRPHFGMEPATGPNGTQYDSPVHGWRLTVAQGEQTETIDLPTGTARFLVSQARVEARELFAKRTEDLRDELRTRAADTDTTGPATRMACEKRLETLSELTTGVPA